MRAMLMSESSFVVPLTCRSRQQQGQPRRRPPRLEHGLQPVDDAHTLALGGQHDALQVADEFGAQLAAGSAIGLAQDHGRPDVALGPVVGRLGAFVAQERPQRGPLLEEILAQRRRFLVLVGDSLPGERLPGLLPGVMAACRPGRSSSPRMKRCHW